MKVGCGRHGPVYLRSGKKVRNSPFPALVAFVFDEHNRVAALQGEWLAFKQRNERSALKVVGGCELSPLDQYRDDRDKRDNLASGARISDLIGSASHLLSVPEIPFVPIMSELV